MRRETANTRHTVRSRDATEPQNTKNSISTKHQLWDPCKTTTTSEMKKQKFGMGTGHLGCPSVFFPALKPMHHTRILLIRNRPEDFHTRRPNDWSFSAKVQVFEACEEERPFSKNKRSAWARGLVVTPDAVIILARFFSAKPQNAKNRASIKDQLWDTGSRTTTSVFKKQKVGVGTWASGHRRYFFPRAFL